MKCCCPFLSHLYHSGAACLDESLDETEDIKEGRQVAVLEARLATPKQRRDEKRSVFVCMYLSPRCFGSFSNVSPKVQKSEKKTSPANQKQTTLLQNLD